MSHRGIVRAIRRRLHHQEATDPLGPLVELVNAHRAKEGLPPLPHRDGGKAAAMALVDQIKAVSRNAGRRRQKRDA